MDQKPHKCCNDKNTCYDPKITKYISQQIFAVRSCPLHQKCPVSKQAVSSNRIFYHSVLISKFTCMRKPGEHIAAWQERILIKKSHTSPQNTSHKQCQLYKVFFLFVSKYSTKHRCHQQEQTDHGIFHNRPITHRQ